AADTFTVNGTSLQVAAGTTTSQTVSGITSNSLTLNGGAGADTFNVTPSAAGGAIITVNGDLPGPAAGSGLTGDTLNLNLAGKTGTNVSGTTFSGSGGFGGTVTFTNAANVVYSGIESLANGATISGTVFNDTNGNGVLNSGETGLGGVTVGVDVNGDTIPDL